MKTFKIFLISLSLSLLTPADSWSFMIRGVKVTASSCDNAELTPEKTVDRDMKTRWSSKFADNQWLIFDLGKEYEIHGFKVFWETAYAKEYSILGSNDKTNWKLIKHIHSYGEETVDIGKTKFRYYKLDLIKRGKEFGFSIWEFRFLNEKEVKKYLNPEPPPWKGNRIGFSEEVLPPWIPVTVSGSKVGVWGRTVQFGALPFPSSVISQESEILDGPVTLTGIVNGKPLVWNGAACRVVSAKPHLVRLGSSAGANTLRCEGTVSIEYDGMIRADFSLIPKNKNTLIEKLVLEIPLKSGHALFLHTWPVPIGSAENSGALPLNGYRGQFKPFVWLGDHNLGFCWFSESDKNFFNAHTDRVIEILRDGDRTVLRINIISIPRKTDLPLEYTFGFQATPVKPAVPDAWDYRIVHSGGYGLQQGFFDFLARNGVRTMVFHEHWNDIQNHTEVTHATELKKLVSDCHSRKIQLLLYFCDQMSEFAPEWKRYHEECLVYPRGLPYYREYYKQTTYTFCNRSHLQDFLVEGIDRIMSEYGIDGVFLDQMSWPTGCSNLRHGCGYKRPDGSVGKTYPIFSTRQIIKRIYTIVKHHNPAGQVNVHQSACMTIPTLSFATSYWDGEQLKLQLMLRKLPHGTSALDILPLDTFCAEFMGRNWGVPAELLTYPDGQLKKEKEISIALLHDVPWRPFSNEETEYIGRLWKTFDAFGRHESDWLPYWENKTVVQTQPVDIKVSLYNRPGKGLIAVVVNTGKQTRDAVVNFNLTNLEQRAGLTAYDVFAKKRFRYSAGKLQLQLGPLEHAVVRLKPDN
ncbi:MAG: discoidin domain-containing protein [Elusimicrobia bacterium]|nr:discoidin domain-containing protein [Elusimicrobiota bacterium]